MSRRRGVLTARRTNALHKPQTHHQEPRHKLSAKELRLACPFFFCFPTT